MNLEMLMKILKRLYRFLVSPITIPLPDGRTLICREENDPAIITRAWNLIHQDVPCNLKRDTDRLWVHTHNEQGNSFMNIGKYYSVDNTNIVFWIGAEIGAGENRAYLFINEGQVNDGRTICGVNLYNHAYVVPIDEFSTTGITFGLRRAFYRRLTEFLEDIFR